MSRKSGHEYGAGGAFLHVCTRGIDIPDEINVFITIRNKSSVSQFILIEII